jgi:hypothetical protein
LELIINDKMGLVVQCLYYGYNLDNVVSSSKFLHYGDILSVTNEGKYVLGIGWFVLVIVNGESKEYVRTVDLENAVDTNKAQAILDLMLHSFIVSYQLDKALENRNKEHFLSLSKKQKESSYLFKRIAGKIPANS